MNERNIAFNRILVPVDYSSHSRAALRTALALAKRLESEVDVVHVWDLPTYVTDSLMVGRPEGGQRPLADLIRENAEHDMATFLAEALPANPEVRVRHFLLSGEPASVLVRKLQEGEHDLVVMGTHGRTGLLHVLMGSVAEKLVRLSPVPVLTIPRTGKA